MREAGRKVEEYFSRDKSKTSESEQLKQAEANSENRVLQ